MIETVRRVVLTLAAALLVVPCGALYAQQMTKAQQYIYVLRVTPRMHDPSAWTEAANGVVAQHFAHLAKAAEAGKVILAGRTTESLAANFGLVILEAENEQAARLFMEADPTIVAGIMTATLHPYSVALQRKQ